MSSVKIPFPAYSDGTHLSDEETKEIEGAVTQMEVWNSLVSVPVPKPAAGFIARQPQIKPADTLVIEVSGRKKQKELATESACDFQSGDLSRAVTTFEHPDEHQVPFDVVKTNIPSIPVSPTGNHRNTCSDHVVHCGIHSHCDLQKNHSVNADSVVEMKPNSPISDRLYWQLPPLKKERFPFLLNFEERLEPRKPIILEKRELQHFPFRVRRKPVPRFSDLPSSPTPAPRDLKNSIKYQILNSFPTLDSGSICHHYQLDPEILEAPSELRVRNLILKKLLGVGGQGRVYLAQGPPERADGFGPTEGRMAFAVKVMVKHRHLHYEDVLREQKLLRRLRGNKFLLHLEASFHDKKNFYLITEYHTGGDLDDLLRARGYLPTSAARVYSAELCAAVVFLHENYILHRDIKPSNILIKSDGHISLGDFGLAVDFLDHAVSEDENSCATKAEPIVRGCAGTTIYMAPEALRGEFYGFKADWWSVGATCYNLFEGTHPWHSVDHTWLAEFAGLEPVRFRLTSGSHIRSFVRALLQRDPGERLGDSELFSHSFFNGLRIQDIYNGKLVPPYIPKAFDTEHIPNALTRKDILEIGGYYADGEAPTTNYSFYGSNLPRHEATVDEVNAAQKPEKLCLPFNCSPSLHEFLQLSFNAIESGTLCGGSGSLTVPPPGHLDAISGPTVVEELGLDDTEWRRREIIRKDSKFSWSMLSVGKGQSGHALEDRDTRVFFSYENVQITTTKSSLQETEHQCESTVHIVRPAPKSNTSVGVVAGQAQHAHSDVEQEIPPKMEHEPKVGIKSCELATPVIPLTAVLTSPPHQKVIHREAKLKNDSIKSAVHHEGNTLLLLSPASGYNRGNSTFETIPPSSLGFGTGEGDGDMTGLTTFDLGTSVPPGVCSSEGPLKPSGICRSDIDETREEINFRTEPGSDLATTSTGSSVLGEPDSAQESHLLRHINKSVDNDSGDGNSANNIKGTYIKKSVEDIEAFDKPGITDYMVDIFLSPGSVYNGSLASEDDSVYSGIAGVGVTALFKQIVWAVLRGVRIFVSMTCNWKFVRP